MGEHESGRRVAVLLLCLLAAAVPAWCVTVEITAPTEEPSKWVKGEWANFSCRVDGAGDDDYWISWYFEDDQSTVCDWHGYVKTLDHQFTGAGKFYVWCVVLDLGFNQVAWTKKAYWVLWVDLELLSAGSCPEEGNDKYQDYVDSTKDPDGSGLLGLGRFVGRRNGWGIAVHGVVAPPDWPDALAFSQRATGVVYCGANGDEVRWPRNDEEDVEAAYLDMTLPDIYYMDYPGVQPGYEGVHRMRCNFTEVVFRGQAGGTECSNKIEWSTAQSWHWDNGWRTFTDPQVATFPGDNQLWPDRQLSATERDWDMQ